VVHRRHVELEHVHQRLEVQELFVHGRGIGHRELLAVAVALVLSELGEGEGAGHGDLDRAGGDGSEELHLATQHRPRAADRPHHPRHRRRPSEAPLGRARPVGVEPLEGVGELVEVGLAPLLAVRDEVDARVLHVGHGQPHGIVLRPLEIRRLDAPHLRHADAGDDVLLESRPVHEPVGLRIAADHGGEDAVSHRGALSA
jgi:hypothetical protein